MIKSNSMYNFGIIVDMGKNVGSGHISRCISIAEKLHENKKKVIFLIKDEKELQGHFRRKKFHYKVIHKKIDQKFIKNIEKYSYLFKNLIIDIPLKNEFVRSLTKNFHTFCIDDVGEKDIFGDVLINGQFPEKFHKYKINNKPSKIFCGSNFFILNPEFNKITRSTVSKNIQNIVLIFGGADECNITIKLIPILLNLKYNLTAILGPTFKNKIPKKFQNCKNLKILNNPKNLPMILNKSDLVISASGTTTYELAYLGKPCILIPTDNKQKIISKEMQKNGFGLNYGKWDNNSERLHKFILKINDHNKMKMMSSKGKKIIDGYGLNRVVKKLLIYEKPI